jgi:integrase
MAVGIILAPMPKRKHHTTVWSKNINRNFSDEELEKFFSVVSNKKHLICFKLQAYLGLRISEAVSVNIKDIDFERRKLRVWSFKTKEMDFLHLHDKIFESIQTWVRIQHSEIEKHDGFLIFSCGGKTHMSRDTMRHIFKTYLKKVKLDDCYVELYTTGNQCHGKASSRKLYRLSTHSLRHYYITKIYKKTLNPVVTQKCARHREFKSTSYYINLDPKDTIEALDNTFGEETKNQEPKTNDDMAEFVKMFKAWKNI